MTDDPVPAQIARANPETDPHSEASDKQLLAEILATPATPPRRRRSAARVLVPALSLAVVIAVVVVFARAGGTHQTASPGTSVGTQRILVRVEPTPSASRVTADGMRHEITLLREHLDSLGVAGGSVRQVARDEIVIAYRSARPVDQVVLRALVATPQIAFGDGESDLIAPDGRTVASQLPRGSTAVRNLSQGGNAGPGLAGGMRLYDAVRLASHQRPNAARATLSRIGSQYFTFTKAGRYVRGPSSTRRGRPAHGAVTLHVPQGTLVEQASGQTHTGLPQYQDPQARFFVLRDHLDVIGPTLKHLTASEQNGTSTLTFTLTPAGQRQVHQLTAGIAQRGKSLSGSGNPSYQHLALIENGTLLSVAQINYRLHPEGVDTTATAIPTGLSLPATQHIARQIEQSIPPYALQVISR